MKNQHALVVIVPVLLFRLATFPADAQTPPDAVTEFTKGIVDANKQLSAHDSEVARRFDATELDPEDIDGLPMYQQVSYHRPRAGDVVEVYMGDRMVVQQFGEIRDCIIPAFSWEDSRLGYRGIVEANKPICKPTQGDKKYQPTYINTFNASGMGFINPIKVKVGRNGDIELCHGGNGKCKSGLSEKEVKVGPALVFAEGSLQRTIEYLGKKDSQLKFVYSEYKDDLARAAFNREFEVDLSEGNVVAFKGAVLEVIEATNATITYKVLRHFKD